MAIIAPGIGSGLDVNGIVERLMVLERRPLDLLGQQKDLASAQLSAYGRLRSAMATFQTAMQGLASLDKFRVFAPTSSNESVFTATADEGAAAGNFNVVVTSLASAHKLSSGPFAATTDTVGTGTLNVSVGASSFSLTIDGTNNTLAGIRDAINNSSSNTGVQASILTTTDGSRLVLTSAETGASKALSVTVTGDGDGNDTDNAGLSRLVWTSAGTRNLTQSQAAADAVFSVDGFAATSASNSVTGVIEGVTIDLKAAGSGTLTLSRDDAAIEANVQSFVDAYNALRQTIADLRGGELEAETTLLSIERGIQSVMNTSASITGSAFTSLFEIGISTNDEGDLELDAAAFAEALTTDFPGVSQLLGNEGQGFAFRLEAIADAYLDADGLIDAREDGLNENIEDIGERELDLERRLELVEARLRAQFSALDTLVAQLSATGNFLTQQLSLLSASKK